MKSMTGFGTSRAETELGKITVEARSENHRFLDLKFQLPESTLDLEQKLSDVVKKQIIRGKVKVQVSIDSLRNNDTNLSIDIAKKSKKDLLRLKKELDIKDPIKLEHFLMIKDIFTQDSKSPIGQKQFPALKNILEQAILKLDKARQIEGQKLEKDLNKRIKKIEKLTRTIKNKRRNFAKNASAKLKERITKLLDEQDLDEGRLYQETAYLAERSDITEELVRLEAHIGKFKETAKKKGTIGKELDFLIQEMNREAGTISAKSKDAEISHVMIEFRSELEKIREQIQNIE